MIEKAANELLKQALENTTSEYSVNSKGQGKDLATGTKALAGAAASVGTVTAGAIEVLLDPFRLAIYGYNKLKEKFIPKVQEYLDAIPEENLVAPDEAIAGPILEAVKFKTNDDISDLFAALLASAMDSSRKDFVHPAYIQIINELSADEAKILNYLVAKRSDSYPTLDLNAKIKEGGQRLLVKNFSDLGYKADCAHPELIASCIDNLSRLQLTTVPFATSLTDKTQYTPLKEHAYLKPWLEQIKAAEHEPSFTEGILQLTPFGYGFIASCRLGQKAS